MKTTRLTKRSSGFTHRSLAFRRNLICGGLTLVALIFVLNVAATSAQVVAGVSLAAGRNAFSPAGTDVFNTLRVGAEVYSMQRQGSDNVYPRRKVRMELVNPNQQTVATVVAGIGHDSNQTVNGRTGGGRGTGYILEAPAALGGSNSCSSWYVRLTDAETGSTPNPDPSTQIVSARILFFVVNSGPPSVTIQPPPKFGIVQSDTVDKNIAVPFFGSITLQANWDTDEFTLDNYQLKFSLINTHGTIVATNTGYSRDSIIIGISDSQRMKIQYWTTCADFGGGQPWKIRVRGASQGKVKNVDLKGSISPPITLDVTGVF
jgi:hypothetical protein